MYMMKRLLSFSGLALTAVVVVTAVFLAPTIAAPPVSEEIVLPFDRPIHLTPNTPSIITLTIELSDPAVKGPKVQFFNPGKNKWQTLTRLRDDGKGPDAVKGDVTFSGRVWLSVSSGQAQVGKLRGNGNPKIKATVADPPQLRFAAKKKGQRNIVVSPLIPMDTSGTFRDPGVGVEFEVPRSAVEVPLADPIREALPGLGFPVASFRPNSPTDLEGQPAEAPPTGCSIDVSIEDNGGALSLPDWLSQYYEAQPGEADEEVTVDGVTAVRRSGTSALFGNPFVVVFIPDGTRVFLVQVAIAGDQQIVDQCITEFDSFLTSFRRSP